jgi:hypothetical protein
MVRRQVALRRTPLLTVTMRDDRGEATHRTRGNCARYGLDVRRRRHGASLATMPVTAW